MALSRPSWGEVDGGGHGAPALAFLDGVTVPSSGTELAAPSRFRGLRWVPERRILTAQDEDGTGYVYHLGYRLRAEIQWDFLTAEQRSEIIGYINSNSTGAIRLWPHSDVTSVHYDMLFDPATNLDQYLHDMPLGYTGAIVLIGKQRYKHIPITADYRMFANKDTTYSCNRNGYFCSSSTTYSSDAPITYFRRAGR